MFDLDRLRQELRAGPDYFPHRLDTNAGRILFLRMSRAAFAQASFLDDRIIDRETQGHWQLLDHVLSAVGDAAIERPLHFLFHLGHVGSTLLSRFIEGAGGVLALREPLPLRTLAEAQDDLGQAFALLHEAQLDVILRTLLALWSRGYADTQGIGVKATSASSRLAPRLLAHARDARAIYMHLNAEAYLATLLAGENSPIDLRGMARERMKRLIAITKQEPTQALHQMRLGEIAAMSWCAEMATCKLTVASAPNRVLRLDFNAFLADPPERLAEVFAHLQLEAPSSYIEQAGYNPILARYSKAADEAYSPQLRSEILRESRVRNADEIRKGMTWIEAFQRIAPEALDYA